MSKIDKIIQIVSEPDGVLYGLSETGKMYKYDPVAHIKPFWELEIESPEVDNSACEVEPDGSWDNAVKEFLK